MSTSDSLRTLSKVDVRRLAPRGACPMPMSECQPRCHVWRRDDRDGGRPIPLDARCVCRERQFGSLADGLQYRTEYRRATGEIVLNHLSLKSSR